MNARFGSAMAVLGAAVVLGGACAPSGKAPTDARPAPPVGSPAPLPGGTPWTILYDGLGDLHHPVTTRSPLAQRFFDQGLRLIYGFNHPEAIRSFREAARLDPDCAMAYWGVAVALGPNYNLPSDPEGEATAREMVAKARLLEPKVTPAERDYIEAAVARYAGPVAADRHENDRAYADAMREVAKTHPEDPDAAVLFAESMMDLRPWMLWQDGQPAPGTEEIVATLEAVLAKHPEHPGANHYYIHAEEGGPTPEKALPEAKRLPSLMPAVGHVVHMPSHIYIHTGMWAEASDANEAAIKADKAYLAKPHAEGVYSMMYVSHDYQFLAATAAMEGRRAKALEAARNMVAPFDAAMVREMEKAMPGVDYMLAPPWMVMIRFGMWDDLLKEPAPPEDFVYLGAVRHFARALAFARTGKMKEARDEQMALQRFVFSRKDEEMLGPLNSAKATFAVATKLLAGELEAADGHLDDAITLERQAVALEDALNYDEPPPWPLPTREYLGALLLRKKKPAEAIEVYQADLKKYPENGWALFGLEKAYSLGKAYEAKGAHDRFVKAWSRADVTLTSSRF